MSPATGPTRHVDVGVPGGRGAAAHSLGDGDRKPIGERDASARGAAPGRVRGHGARDSAASGGASGSGAEQE
jgi:hypothetical protein